MTLFFGSTIDKGNLFLILELVIINSSGYQSKRTFLEFVLGNNENM